MILQESSLFSERRYYKGHPIVIVKMEALFYAFIEDDFLAYSFYRHGVIIGLRYCYFYLFYYGRFQELLAKELEKSSLLDNLSFNQPVIKKLNELSARGYKICLVSTSLDSVVCSIKCYLNFDSFYGNRFGENLSFKALSKNILQKSNNREMKEYILVSDEILWNLSRHSVQILQTGSLYKILFNFICNKNVLTFPISSTFNRPLIYFMNFIHQRKLNRWWIIIALALAPLFEISSFIYLFFFRIFIVIVVLAYVQWLGISNLFSMKCLMIALLETNNLINFYKITMAAFPIYPYERRFRRQYINYGMMRNYASFRIGIFIFIVANLVYLSNFYFFLIQISYMLLFLKFPLRRLYLYPYFSVFFALMKSYYSYLILAGV